MYNGTNSHFQFVGLEALSIMSLKAMAPNCTLNNFNLSRSSILQRSKSKYDITYNSCFILANTWLSDKIAMLSNIMKVFTAYPASHIYDKYLFTRDAYQNN